MHAIRLHEFGPAENLRYEQVPDPVPGPGQVRIEVRAIGVHLLDATIRSGTSGGPFPLPELPAIPGREVAGVVDALGPGVAERWRGRRVAVHLGVASSGYAERAVADANRLHELPDELDDQTAVAMIGTGRTTIAVLEAAPIAADDVVLVTAAAGGIGNLLVQAARHAGAFVVGLAGGARKVQLVRELGAQVAVDYTDPAWPATAREALDDRRLTAAYDSVGGPVGREALQLLGPRGRLVIVGWSSGELTALTAEDLYPQGLTVTSALGPAMLDRPGGLRGLEEESLAAARDGRLVPLVNEPFALRDAAAAHTALVSRGTVGKTVLVP